VRLGPPYPSSTAGTNSLGVRQPSDCAGALGVVVLMPIIARQLLAHQVKQLSFRRIIAEMSIVRCQTHAVLNAQGGLLRDMTGGPVLAFVDDKMFSELSGR
jgi:hypothetical protein